MKLLPTILVSLLTILLGTLAVLQQTKGNLDFIFGSRPLEAGETLYQFNPNDVGRIQILNSDGTRAEVVKTDTAWMIKEPWRDYADARIIRDLIKFAARLHIEDSIKLEKDDDLADYGLGNDCIKVELFNKTGQSLCHFRMGRYTSWRSFDPTLKLKDPTQKPPSFPTIIIQPTEKGLEDHLYVCADFANPAERTILMRDLFSNGLRLFRDHQLFHNSPAAAAQITLKEKNSEIILKRDKLAKDSEWKIEKPYQLATSPKALMQLIGGLSKIHAGAVVDESDIALPPPLPENIAFTIGIEYFMPDGSLGAPVTAMFYPPENDDSTVVPVVVFEGAEKKRSAILLVPSGSGSILATLPRDVNALRSRTMTAMNVRDIDAITLQDFTGRSVKLTLETDPHERAARWYAHASREDAPGQITASYDGPANSKQVFNFFQTLFKNEVLSFTNDASTSPEDYGLDQPVRRITIEPKKGTPITYIIGIKLSPKYYARRTPKGRVIEVSEKAYLAGVAGESHRELEFVAQPTNDSERPVTGLEIFGLDQPKVIEINETTLHLGKANSRLFFANQLDAEGNHTPHVVQIAPDQISNMPLADFYWRGERLWNINRFEINGLKIKKRDHPLLELAYDFYNPKPWSASQGPKDVTSLLNTNKADKLLQKLTDIEVQRWVGPVADAAASRLTDPSLVITIFIEELSDDGRPLGKFERELRLSEVIKSPTNLFFYGKADSQPSYLLLDAATHQRLSVDLLDQ